MYWWELSPVHQNCWVYTLGRVFPNFRCFLIGFDGCKVHIPYVVASWTWISGLVFYKSYVLQHFVWAYCCTLTIPFVAFVCLNLSATIKNNLKFSCSGAAYQSRDVSRLRGGRSDYESRGRSPRYSPRYSPYRRGSGSPRYSPRRSLHRSSRRDRSVSPRRSSPYRSPPRRSYRSPSRSRSVTPYYTRRWMKTIWSVDSNMKVS